MKKVMVCICMFLSLLIFNGCKDKEIEVTSISIKEDTFKNVYQKDEQMNLEGLIIIVKYSDNSINELEYPSAGVDVSYFNTSIIGEKKVIITYKGKNIVTKVNVVESIPVYLLNKKIELLDLDKLTLNDKSYVISLIDEYDKLTSSEKSKIVNYSKLLEAYNKVLELELLDYKNSKKESIQEIINTSGGDYQYLLVETLSYIDNAQTKQEVDWYYNAILAIINNGDYDPYIYINDIEIINEDVKTTEEGKYIVLDYVDGLIYQLEWVIYPSNSISKKIEFVYDTDNEIASVNDIGTVTFHKKGAITIYLKSVDGSNVIEIIKLIAK